MSCLRNALAGVGCVTVLAAAGIAGYQYRAQLVGAVRSVTGDRGATRADTAQGVGWPSETALRAARRKEAAMGRARGPAFVVVTADEMAALVAAGLDPLARAALDSLRVILGPGRFALEAQVRTSRLGREALGPLAGVLAEREPLRLAGPAAVAEPGRVAWRPDEVQLRAFPFPASLVPRLVDALTGGRDGIVPLVVPSTVGDVRIRPDGVTFYRRTD